jgi:hypothetical protein
MAQLKVPKGSEEKAKYHLGQLRGMFARADDHAFLQMIWAVHALQDDPRRLCVSDLPQSSSAIDAHQFIRDTSMGA